jgi:hypothetical protein
MFNMFEDTKYKFPVHKVANDICEFYMREMYAHQVKNKELAIRTGKDFIEPVSWTPALVENHIRCHIIDSELKLRLRLQDLELMREALADQCFKVSASGRITYDERSLKLVQTITKLMRDLEKGLK